MGSHSARTSSGSSSAFGSQPAGRTESSGSTRSGEQRGSKPPETSSSSVGRLRSEMTSEALTSDAGLVAWTSSLRAGRARDSLRPREVERLIQTSGDSFARLLSSPEPRGFSSKMSTRPRGPWLSLNFNASDSVLLGIAFARLLWELPTADRARFYWPTPTAKANHWAPSMRKWPAYRRLQDAIMTPCPRLFEWEMGFPVGWISSAWPGREPFQRWLRAHSSLWLGDSHE